MVIQNRSLQCTFPMIVQKNHSEGLLGRLLWNISSEELLERALRNDCLECFLASIIPRNCSEELFRIILSDHP